MTIIGEWTLFLTQIRMIASQGEFGRLIFLIEHLIPHVSYLLLTISSSKNTQKHCSTYINAGS